MDALRIQLGSEVVDGGRIIGICLRLINGDEVPLIGLGALQCGALFLGSDLNHARKLLLSSILECSCGKLLCVAP